jgi:hypothetical protein
MEILRIISGIGGISGEKRKNGLSKWNEGEAAESRKGSE